MTREYVEPAIARYERDGREAAFAYYNSDADFDGQWYMVITDQNGAVLAHPGFPHLIGTALDVLSGYEPEHIPPHKGLPSNGPPPSPLPRIASRPFAVILPEGAGRFGRPSADGRGAGRAGTLGWVAASCSVRLAAG